MKVIGIGEKKTSRVYRACDKFILFEILKSKTASTENDTEKAIVKDTIDTIY